MSRIKVVARKISIRALIFLGYLFLGAGVFLGIEKEAREKHNSELEKELRDRLYTMRNNCSITNATLEELQTFIKSLILDGLYKQKNWDFVNAFFFSGNVVTTIGYGHITPITVAGKLVCILYAIVGIPIAGYFLRTVGNELNNLFTFAIKYFERRRYNREAEKIEMKSTITAFVLTLFWLLMGGVIFQATEIKWDFVDAVYFSFITLTTIGFGDLVPGISSTTKNQGLSLAVEMAALIYYVIGLSMLSGVIFSVSNFIEEKTKKLDMQDPMDAIRNLRIENLNTKAMKKLGYKMTNGPLDQTTHYNLSMRRGTIVPDDTAPHRMSRLFDDTQRMQNKSSMGFPPAIPNGTSKRRSKTSDDFVINTKEPINEEKSVAVVSPKDDQTTEVDGISSKTEAKKSPTKNCTLTDVEISPVPSRRASSARPLSASSLGSRRKFRLKANTIQPTRKEISIEFNDRLGQNNETVPVNRKEPTRRLVRQCTQPEYRPTGLPSEIFGAPITKTRRKLLERTASDSHTDEIEYNDIMDEILKEHMSMKVNTVNSAKKKAPRSPTPEFLSLTRQFSDESTCPVDNCNKSDVNRTDQV